MRQINQCLRSTLLWWLLSVTATSAAFAGAVSYVYDQSGRLQTILYDDGTQIRYTLDAAGNRTLVTSSQTARPAPPTALALTSSNAVQAVIHWTDSTTSGITGYQVFRTGGASGTATSPLLVPTAVSYTDAGLTPGTNYTYTVVAYIGIVDSLPSNALPVTTPAVARPSPPTGLSATAVSYSQVNLSWSAVTDTGPGQPGLQGYNIYRGGTKINSTAATTYTDTGDSSGTSYSYTVTAYDTASRESDPSAAAPVTTLYEITDVNGNVVTAAANLYSVIQRCPQGLCSNALQQTYGAGQTIATWSSGCASAPTSVASGFSVVSGCSIQAPGSLYNYPILPTPPAGFTAVANSASQVTLTWGASSDAGGPGLKDYTITRNGTALPVQGPAVTSYVDVSLPSNTLFTYVITAVDNNNATSTSATASVTTPSNVPPTVPTGLVATPVSYFQVNLTWNASTDNGTGQPGLQGYHVYRNGTLLSSPTATSYNDTGDASGTLYSYTVSAYDLTGRESAQSTAAAATTLLEITDVNGNVVTAAANLYSTISRCPQGLCSTALYQTYGAAPAIAVWSEGCASAPAGVASGYSVASACSIQAPSAIYHYPILPTPPTGFTATVNSYSQITLAWTASTDAGGPGLQGYTITRNGTTLPLVAPAATSYVDPGLSPSTSYTYVITALDNNNVPSSTSATASGTTPAIALPPPPVNLTGMAVSSSQINLTWGAPVYSGGAGIRYYNVTRNGSPIGTPTATSISDTGLALGTTYNYAVTTQDNVGQVSQAATVSVQTNGDTTPPSAPGAVSASNITGTTATLSWGAASDNVGVTNYSYQLNGGTWVSVGNVLSTGLTGLTGVTGYTVAVRANDAAGNIGASSSGSFTTGQYSDTPVMTIGSPSAVQAGFMAGSYGSMSPATTTNGLTYQTLNDVYLRPAQGGGYVGSGISLSGFSADPGQAWLTSVAALGVTRTGASATYSYGAGVASWSWNIAPFGFSSGTATCTIVHK